MSKLYPPYIEGTIPAFCDSKEGTILKVPFSMNRAVGKREVAGFYLKIKTIHSDKYLYITPASSYNLETQTVYFDLTTIKDKLNIGQFYKVQIAYEDTFGGIGYYSSVGIVKYTSRPSVYIDGLEKNTLNIHSYSYLGCYSQESLSEDDIKDYTEKVYSYRFVVYDKLNNIIADTGFLLHNNSKDINSYESQDEFLYIADFKKNQTYYIQYTIITNNNLEISSSKYRLVSSKSIEPDVKTEPIPTLNFDNGYVDIGLNASNYIDIIKTEEIDENGKKVIVEQEIENTISGFFVLSRKTTNGAWEEVLRFALINEKLSQWHWKDFTVEQGKNYIYSLQEYNDYGLYSERIISNKIYVDFEDAFLFDGQRQLRIRFNPKVSTFKTDHLESKIDTIGSKFPFIFRNGNVAYKEFPISGLISYHMDDANLFGIDEDFVFTEKFTREKTVAPQLDEYKVKTTGLVGYNFSSERDFKLNVLDWLNNGKPKLFRSPSEGNYIVRLLNTSLSPEDTVSRLIHTFNSTAYEVAECNYENLNKYGFISITEPNILQTRWMTIRLYEKSISTVNETIPYIELMQHTQATSVYFYDMLPGEMVYINGKSIVIGATGTYFIDNGEIIESIGIPTGVVYTGSMTYSYEDTSMNTFDTIVNVQMNDVVAHQFIGSYENILNQIEDLKTKVSNFYYLDFNRRDISKVYANWIGTTYEKNKGLIVLYRDKNFTSLVKLSENREAVIARYEREIKYYEEYYSATNSLNRERALKNINYDYQEQYFYRKLAFYEIAYDKGKITYEEYRKASWKLIEEYNDFIQTIGDPISGFDSEPNTELFWADTALIVVQVSEAEITAYLNQEKNKAMEKAKEKYLQNIERISSADTSLQTFESPLVIYQYDLTQIELETSYGTMISIGFTPVKELRDEDGNFIEGKLTEEYFLVPQAQLQDRYYIKNELGNYDPITEFIEDAFYYIKKPYEFYYDPKQPMFIFVSQDTFERIKEFEKDKIEGLGLTDFEIQNNFEIYSTKCYIDGNEIDLQDDVNVKINTPTKFEEIKLDCGVVLNCGYEIQLLEYFDEFSLQNYQLLKNLQKILNSSWEDRNEDWFKAILSELGLSNSIAYDDIIFEVQVRYDIIYAKYLRELTQILREKEVIE